MKFWNWILVAILTRIIIEFVLLAFGVTYGTSHWYIWTWMYFEGEVLNCELTLQAFVFLIVWLTFWISELASKKLPHLERRKKMNLERGFYLIIVVLFSISWVGYFGRLGEFSKSQYVGTYSIQKDGIQSTLRIKEDGTYEQLTTYPNGSSEANENVWHESLLHGTTKIFMQEFRKIPICDRMKRGFSTSLSVDVYEYLPGEFKLRYCYSNEYLGRGQRFERMR